MGGLLLKQAGELPGVFARLIGVYSACKYLKQEPTDDIDAFIAQQLLHTVPWSAVDRTQRQIPVQMMTRTSC